MCVGGGGVRGGGNRERKGGRGGVLSNCAGEGVNSVMTSSRVYCISGSVPL